MTTLQAGTQRAIGAVVDRHYTLGAILIAATIALVIGVAIGFGVANLTNPSASASLTSVGGSSSTDPIQGGR